MKRFNILSTAVVLALLTSFGCKKDAPELGDAPTEADAAFTYQASTESDNIIVFTASNSEVIAVWDFGNGTKGQGTKATGTYPNKGTYTVMLTIFSRGGTATSTQDIVIAEDDLSLLSSPIFNFLTGGAENGGVKTWVIDSNLAGHFGVGPNPTGAAGNFPEHYEATENEKAGGGMYDDKYRFSLSAFTFDMVTHGDVYINAAQESNFPGSYEASVGDFTAPLDDQLGESWTVSTEGDTTITFSGNSFIGFNTGVQTYQIINIGENELFLRYLDNSASDLAWYLRLVPEGYDSGGGGGGGGGGGDTTDTTVGYALPIDFENEEPEFSAFGNSTIAYIDNPDSSGINTSSRVLETVHGNETWAGLFVDLGDKLDFSTATSLEVKVWAPATGDFRIKIENQDNDQEFIEKDFNVSTANEWVQVTIDFSEADPDIYDRFVVFPGWDVANAGTFYLDDFEQN
jgi:hypothetical protein